MTCDRSAIEDAFVEGMKKTVRFLLSRGCPAEEAEELAQIAWSKAWEKREQFRGDCELVSWIITIALNLLRMHRRVKWVFVEESALNSLGQRPQHDRKILVDQILALLDPDTRRILTDCYLAEQTSPKSNSLVFRAVRRARQAGTRAKLIAAHRAASA